MSTPLLRPNFTPKVQAVLERLYNDAMRTDLPVLQAAGKQGLDDSDPGFYEKMSGVYLPVLPDFGNGARRRAFEARYELVRALKARGGVSQPKLHEVSVREPELAHLFPRVLFDGGPVAVKTVDVSPFPLDFFRLFRVDAMLIPWGIAALTSD